MKVSLGLGWIVRVENGEESARVQGGRNVAWTDMSGRGTGDGHSGEGRMSVVVTARRGMTLENTSRRDAEEERLYTYHTDTSCTT